MGGSTSKPAADPDPFMYKKDEEQSPLMGEAPPPFPEPPAAGGMFWFCVVSLYLLVLASCMTMTIVTYTYLGGTGDWTHHLTLEPIAFVGCGMLGVTSYRIFRDALGWTHGTAKAIHAFFMSSAAAISFAGVYIIWYAHQAAAESNIETYGTVHLQSLHAWLGIVFETAWLGLALSALLIFYFGSPGLKKAYVEPHKFFGACTSVVVIAVVLLGILDLDGRGDNSSYNQLGYKMSGVLIVMAGIAAAGVFWFAPPKRK